METVQQRKKPATTQAATAQQVDPKQKRFTCSRCESAFWRYAPKLRSVRTGKVYCSVACRRLQVAKDQVGFPRVVRSDPQQCTSCLQFKPLCSSFALTRHGQRGARCRECRTLHGTSAEAKRRSHLRIKFGISLEQWIDIYRAQQGRCDICQQGLPSLDELNKSKARGTKWSARNWNTDHCHKTGKVRGILCRACNQALGSLRDDPAVARRAAEYLERHALI